MRFVLVVLLTATIGAGCTPQPDPSAAASGSAATSAAPSDAPASTPAAARATPQPTTAPATATDSAVPAGLPLSGTTWEWQATTYSDGSAVAAGSPSSYTVDFLDGGTLEVRADCNGVGGSYSAGDEDIDLALGPSTEVACPSGSQAGVFLRDLGAVVSYTIEDGSLLLALDVDAGSMRFAAPAPGAAAAVELRGDNTLPQELAARLDTLLAQGVTFKLPDPVLRTTLFPASPGAILLLDTPDGRYLKAAGYARREDRTPMQPGDRFQIGSVTKLFVGVLLLQLEEAALLSLDDPLSRWLPDQAARIPNGERITLRMLANHTAGLADYTAGFEAFAGAEGARELLEQQYTPAELVERAIGAGPLFEPGAADRWSYSNAGYLLLGMVLEKASGRSMAELLAERIFEPLAMEDTLFPEGIPEPGSIVNGYLSFAGENTTRWNTSQAWAAGAIESTMPDMLAFARALASGALFQQPATLDRMTSFVRAPALAGAGYNGYGIGIAEFGDGILGHYGRTPGFETVLMLWPERGITFAGMANASQGSVASWQVLLEQTLAPGR